MMNLNGSTSLVSFLLGATMCVACVLLYLSTDPLGKPAGIWRTRNRMAFNDQTTKLQDLVEVLEEAAMDGNTVIITTLNEAWAKPNSILDLFLESFHIGEQIEHLLRHLVIVCMDPKSFERCKAIHSHCFFLTTQGVDFATEKRYLTKDYLKMMWRRLEFLKIVLEQGYNFLFTDLDIMWFRNPFLHFPSSAHLIFASDFFNGNPSDRRNPPNNGFVYVKSSKRTIEFYKYWNLCRKQFPGVDEQTVLNKIKHDSYVALLEVNMHFLSTAYFGGFCEPSKDLSKVCTMHANCCVGIESKLHDLRVLVNYWKNYTARPKEERNKGGFTWRVPDKCKL